MATVLIADDDKFTRTALERIFSQDEAFASFDVDIVTASNGEEGLAAFKSSSPDVVIVDLLMPKLDGFSMCKAIRAEPEGDRPVIIVVSGIYRDSAIAQRVQKEYGAKFFVKPYQLKNMTEHVAQLLANAPTSAAGDDSAPAGETAAPSAAATASAGNLAERPLAAVLLDLVDAHATGNLILRRAGVEKTISLLFGHPVSVRSSLRDETLGHFLLSRGIITDTDHTTAIRAASATQKRLGEILIEMDVLTPEELADHLIAQLRHKLVQSLRWPDGSWEFEPRGDIANAGGNVDTVELVLTGLRHTATMEKVPDHIAVLGDSPLHLTPRGSKLFPALRHHLNNKFSEVWSEGTTLSALLASAIGRDAVLVALDVLRACDGLRAVVANAEEQSEAQSIFPEESGSISVQDLSEHSRVTKLPQPPGDAQAGSGLYSMLFEGDDTADPADGESPLEIPDDAVPSATDSPDSGYIDVRGMAPDADSQTQKDRDAARRMLLAEFLRIQGGDHYVVLEVDPMARDAEISAAVVERRSKFSMDWFSRFDLGRDYAKLERIHAAYTRANDTLMDADKRRAYDVERAGGEVVEKAPALDAEVAFRAGEEHLHRGELGKAIERLRTAVHHAPQEASYHAALGWALFVSGDRSARAADEARQSLNQALAINPDHAQAHECKGIITAELGDDDAEAQFHLELAVNADPGRTEALRRLEDIWTRRGKFRPLERLYKKLIYRAAGDAPQLEHRLWRKLAELYRDRLDDTEAARIAFETAARLMPNDTSVQAALADLSGGTADRFYERCDMLRNHWRSDPTAPGPGLELLRAAQQAARPDAVFLAASALIARGVDNSEALEIYERYRPRFVVRAQRQLSGERWRQVCHPDDDPAIGALMGLLEPAVRSVLPLSMADLEIDDSMGLDADTLPEDIERMLRYVAHMLQVSPPALYVRPDFGHQIHLAAVEPPVLLAGDDALAAPERAELCFRMARAMTYRLTGRTIGGAQPARVLKQAVLAAFTMAHPNSPVDDPDGLVEELRNALAYLPEDNQRRVHDLVTKLTQQSRSLNLSKWAKGLARTADRVGLVLCGDLPAAVRFASDSAGQDAHLDLVDFGVSATHLRLRTELGLSIDV